MENYNPEFDRIRDLMQTRPEGISITDIARSLGINRNSVTKYLDILQMQGFVDAKKRGTSKVYFLTRRLPVYPVKRICTHPLIIIDMDLVVSYANQSFLDLTSLLREDCLNQRIDHLGISVPEAPDTSAFLRAALMKGEQRRDIMFGQKKGLFRKSATLLPVVFENGKPGLAIIAETQDQNAAVTTSPVPAVDTGSCRIILNDQMEYYVRFLRNGTVLDVNEAYCHDTGRTRDGIIGMKYRPLIPTEDQKRIATHLSALTASKPVEYIEHRAVMGNGETRWQRWKDCAVFDDDGTLVEYRSFGIDITDLMQVRQQLKKMQETVEDAIAGRTEELRETNRQIYEEIAHRERAEQQLLLTQFALDNAGDIVFWVNQNAEIRYANHRAAQDTGYSAKELSRVGFATLIPHYDLSRWDELWIQLKREPVVHIESLMAQKDNHLVPVDICVNYVKFKDNEYACCFIRDISERRRSEEALRQANRKLNVLASVTRHDIMNKVTIVLAYLGRAKKVAQNPVLLGYLDKQENAVKAMRSQIAFTRDYKDLGLHPPAWFSIQEIAAKAWEEHRTEGITFTSDLTGIEIYADPFFEKVFDMVIEYSLRHGGLITEISCSSSTVPEGMVISIRHNGSGIPADQKSGIFYGETHNTESMGLFLASEILSITGMKIRETGTQKKGSNFEIVVQRGNFRIKKPLI
jgi:PAS domain S-box-containing protein